MTGSAISPEVRRNLPRTDHVRHPSTFTLSRFRWTGAWVLRWRYDIRLHGVENVPETGAVIMASNHVGILDGPLLAILSPRPVHALTKYEMFVGVMGFVLRLVGQIPLVRQQSDPNAAKLAVKVLRSGGAMGIYPEGSRGDGEFRALHRGAAYFALVTGAPVVPVAMFGTREPGGGVSSLPARGARIDIVYGDPFQVDAVPWPRRREHVDHVVGLMQKHMQNQLDHAKALTGRELPGPLPPEESDE